MLNKDPLNLEDLLNHPIMNGYEWPIMKDYPDLHDAVRQIYSQFGALLDQEGIRALPILHAHEEYLEQQIRLAKAEASNPSAMGQAYRAANPDTLMEYRDALEMLQFVMHVKLRALRRLARYFAVSGKVLYVSEAEVLQVVNLAPQRYGFSSVAAYENFYIAWRLFQAGEDMQGHFRHEALQVLWEKVAEARGLKDSSAVRESAIKHGWFSVGDTVDDIRQKVRQLMNSWRDDIRQSLRPGPTS